METSHEDDPDDDAIGWVGDYSSLTIREIEALLDVRMKNPEVIEHDPSYYRLLFARWLAEHHIINEFYESRD